MIKISSYIPTIYIQSSIPKYEKIKVYGKYNISNFSGVLGIKAEVNEVTVFLLMSDMSMSADKKRFELKVHIKCVDMPEVNVKFIYILGTPNKVNVSLNVGDLKYELLMLIYTPELAFSFIIKTPIENFEELWFKGQLGSTTLKSIFSFKNHRIKRSSSMEELLLENSKENLIELEFALNKTRYKRFSIKKDALNRKFSFDFHDNEFALGIQYDITNLKSFGDILISFNYKKFGIDYSLKVTYDIPDEVITHGINIKISLNKDGNDFFAGKISRTLGRTVAELRTPIDGWNLIKLNMSSDWKTFADIYFQRNSRVTQIHLEQHGPYDYKIIFITPFDGYHHIEITSKKTEDTIVIIVVNEHKKISEISLRIRILDLSKATGSLEVKWDAIDGIFVHINTSFDGVKVTFSVETSFSEVRSILVELAIKRSGNERRTKAVLRINEKYIIYESFFIMDDEKIDSKSQIRTNMEYFKFKKSETKIHLEFTR